MGPYCKSIAITSRLLLQVDCIYSWHGYCKGNIVGMVIARGNSWHGYCKGPWDAFGMHYIWDAFGMQTGCKRDSFIVGTILAREHRTWHVKTLNKL